MSTIEHALDAAVDIMASIINEFKKMSLDKQLNSRNMNALSTCIKTLHSLKAYEDKDNDASDLSPEEVETEVAKLMEKIQQKQIMNGKSMAKMKAVQNVNRIINDKETK